MEKLNLERKYSKLLLDSNYLKLELLYHKPNIFSALKIAEREIRHSNFLGWLLDPNQNHGLGSRFLKLILSDILSDHRIADVSITSIGTLNLNKAQVFREWRNIDILVKIDDLVITIENKIWSGEGKDQLKRYKDIIEGEFGTCSKIFVFLTPLGLKASMSNDYIDFSYKRIASILELMTEAYYEAISPSVMVYLNDYLETIKTKFMKNGDVNKLAREIYLNHRELFDFVFNHTPNPLHELQHYFSMKLDSFGWVKKTSSKNFVRFLPASLKEIIPNNSKTWGHEAFLFEFLINIDKVTFYFTIAPGDLDTRDILEEALKDFEPNSMGTQGEYIGYGMRIIEFEAVEHFSHELDKLDNYFKVFLQEINEVVKKVELKILAKRDQLILINSI